MENPTPNMGKFSDPKFLGRASIIDEEGQLHHFKWVDNELVPTETNPDLEPPYNEGSVEP